MCNEPDDLISTPAEFSAAMRLLAERGVTKKALCQELGRSTPAVGAWHHKGPPRYGAAYLKAQYGITKASLHAG